MGDCVSWRAMRFKPSNSLFGSFHGQVVNPLANNLRGAGINQVMRERGHFHGGICCDEALIQDGLTNVARAYDMRVGQAQRHRRWRVDYPLFRQRCVIAGIIIADSARPMTLGAVGIEIGAHALFERNFRVRQMGKLREDAYVGFVDGGAEHSQAVQGADLVIGNAGGRVSKIAVELTRVDAENVTRAWCVAGQAISRTCVIPRPRLDADSIGDEDVFVQVRRDQVGVAIVGSPLVSRAVNRTAVIAHEDLRLQPAARDVGMRFIHYEIQILDENGAVGKLPETRRAQPQLFVGRNGVAAIWHRHE